MFQINQNFIEHLSLHSVQTKMFEKHDISERENEKETLHQLVLLWGSLNESCEVENNQIFVCLILAQIDKL